MNFFEEWRVPFEAHCPVIFSSGHSKRPREFGGGGEELKILDQFFTLCKILLEFFFFFFFSLADLVL